MEPIKTLEYHLVSFFSLTLTFIRAEKKGSK